MSKNSILIKTKMNFQGLKKYIHWHLYLLRENHEVSRKKKVKWKDWKFSQKSIRNGLKCESIFLNFELLKVSVFLVILFYQVINSLLGLFDFRIYFSFLIFVNLSDFDGQISMFSFDWLNLFRYFFDFLYDFLNLG